MQLHFRISILAAAISFSGCGSESDRTATTDSSDDIGSNHDAVTQTQIVYDSYNGTVSARTQDDLIPYTSGNGEGKTVYGGASRGCNVYYAYESPNSFPANGASVPVNKGYAYMTGNVADCANLCAGWTQSYTTEPSRTKFVHRQLFYYPNYHMIANSSDWSKWYYYNMECMVVDQHQDCLPIFGSDGYLGEFTYGTTYCKND